MKTMKMTFPTFEKALMALLVAGALIAAAPAQAGGKKYDIPQEVRLELQAVMMDYMDFKSVDGLFVHYDHVADKIFKLYKANLHPTIIPAGNYYVLCSHLKTAEGEDIDVDFLVTKVDGEYRVLQAQFNAHDQMAAAGKAASK